MTKEFIPYEQALALKELGFDEPCIAYYDVDKGYSIGYALCYSDRESQPEIGCLAPLYQQAFRWFREKYSLDAIINVGVLGYRANIVDRRGKFKQIAITLEVKEYVYEEAELECLKKLIEIVKQK